jgi:hypothetical protein
MITNNRMCLAHPGRQVHLEVSIYTLISWNNSSKMTSYRLHTGKLTNTIPMSDTQNIWHSFKLIRTQLSYQKCDSQFIDLLDIRTENSRPSRTHMHTHARAHTFCFWHFMHMHEWKTGYMNTWALKICNMAIFSPNFTWAPQFRVWCQGAFK